jgi:multimeric flavodoxin WrbA
MKTLLLVFHSMTGGARLMAEAAAAGAASETGIAVRLLHAPDCGPAEVLDASGYIFATPENLGAISGMMKTSSTGIIMRRWTASWDVRTPR